jgi:squalene synthase HpnC
VNSVDFTLELSRYGPGAPPALPSLADAQAYCRRLARSHYENFTVVSWLLPRELRQHFSNIYAYCRWADDLADEVSNPFQAAQLLDWWEDQLRTCYQGDGTEPMHPVFVALGDTIRQFEIPIEPFAHLLVAFRQDQHVTRYQNAEQVHDYCRYSANPVGRLILSLARVQDEDSLSLSDDICTGLQLANFCQDVARDWHRGRVYLPQDELLSVNYNEADFAAARFNGAFRHVMQQEVARAEQYLQRGQPLVGRVPKAFQFDVALFVAGGLAVLEAIRRQDYNVWQRRPALSKWHKGRIALGVGLQQVADRVRGNLR